MTQDRTGLLSGMVPKNASGPTRGPVQADPWFPHQEQTLALLAKEPRVFDTSDPGTMKTRSALGAWERRASGALLVVAPRSLLRPAWGGDLDRFFPNVTYSIARAENREEAFAVKADVYITNTDAVNWLVKQKPAFFKRFDTVVIDESTCFKHRTSLRSKAMAKIKSYFKYRECLTGTPNSLNITDLWHQVFLLDDGHRLGRKFFEFRSAVQEPVQVGKGAHMLNWVDREFAGETVAELIEDITIRHQFSDVMKHVPPNHTQTLTYELSKKHMKVYKDMKRDAILRLQDATVTAVNAAVLRNKLLQIASGAVYHAEGEWALLDTGRYELILDVVEERRHSVVFFNWHHQKEQLIKTAMARGIKFALIDGTVSDKNRDRIMEEYQGGFYQTLFLHPKTGAHGLTLTRGTATIWASPIYEADFLKQGKHRIYRGTQDQVTETILIEAYGTVENKVYARLNEKTARMVNFLDILKENTNERI